MSSGNPTTGSANKAIFYALRSLESASKAGQDVNGLNVVGFSAKGLILAALAVRGGLESLESLLSDAQSEKQDAIADTLSAYVEEQGENPVSLGAGSVAVDEREDGRAALQLEAAGQEQPILQGTKMSGTWQFGSYQLSPQEEEAVLCLPEAEIAGVLPPAPEPEEEQELGGELEEDDEIEL